MVRMRDVDASVDKHTYLKKEPDQAWLNWLRTREPRQNSTRDDEEDEEAYDEARQEAEAEVDKS